MSKERSLLTTIRENKTPFIMIIVGLFLIELEIFALAAADSGRQSWLQVIDGRGNVIHETDGTNLSDFNKYYFEKTFGPFENYEVRLHTENRPFPFRAWFASAVGIPVGVVLLFGFVARAYQAIFHGDSVTGSGVPETDPNAYDSRLERVLNRIGRLNIFAIGFLIFMAVFAYWVVPNLITYVGRLSVETLTRYRWVVLGICTVFLGLAVWIIYLRYLLARKSIEARVEVDKYRLQLETEHMAPPLRIGNESGESETIRPQILPETENSTHERSSSDHADRNDP